MRIRMAALAASALLAAGALHAQGIDGAVPLTDLLEIEFIDGRAVALDASGGQRSEELHLGEEVLWYGSRGAVGVVITDERVLAVGTRSGGWQELRYDRAERPPADALLGDRVALVVTAKRALGFSATRGQLVEYRLGPRERIASARVGENVGVVLTDRKALGLSAVLGGFSEKRLQLEERIESVVAKSALATVRTNRRLLVFRAPTGSWSERRRELDRS